MPVKEIHYHIDKELATNACRFPPRVIDIKVSSLFLALALALVCFLFLFLFLCPFLIRTRIFILGLVLFLLASCSKALRSDAGRGAGARARWVLELREHAADGGRRDRLCLEGSAPISPRSLHSLAHVRCAKSGQLLGKEACTAPPRAAPCPRAVPRHVGSAPHGTDDSGAAWWVRRVAVAEADEEESVQGRHGRDGARDGRPVTTLHVLHAQSDCARGMLYTFPRERARVQTSSQHVRSTLVYAAA
eukprot:2250966-Rhodomonas_salina.1